MIWDTANSCKVSLQCELSYDASSGLIAKMTCCNLNSNKVSFPCEFYNDVLGFLIVRMTWDRMNN